MKFSLTQVVSLATLVAVVGAIPAVDIRGHGGSSGPVCSTGSVQCCNSVESASNPTVAGLLGPLLGGVTGLVGLGCTEILPVGGTCNAQAVCCENNSESSLVSTGCVPIQL